MAKFTTKEVMQMVMKGVKPSEIKELAALTSDEDDNSAPGAPADEQDDHEGEPEKEPDKQDQGDNQKHEDKQPDEKDVKIAKLEKQLEEAQKANINKDVSGKKENEPTADDILDDFLK